MRKLSSGVELGRLAQMRFPIADFRLQIEKLQDSSMVKSTSYFFNLHFCVLQYFTIAANDFASRLAPPDQRAINFLF